MRAEERIQKIISAAGIASRRKAEILIKEGRISLNGRVVTELGTKADPSRDHIKVDGRLIGKSPRKVYLLLNKPRQVISTVADPQKRRTVIDLVDARERVYPVGRLDYDSEGLILLTNDGAFSKIVSSAGGRFAKVYDVKVRSTPGEAALERLRKGVRLRDGTRLASCKIVPLKQANNSWFRVTLYEGKNRQIREMFKEAGYPVQKLRRRRIGFLTDRALPAGSYRNLTQMEVERVFRMAGAGEQEEVPPS